MEVEILGGTLSYKASTGDWIAEIRANGQEITLYFLPNTGSFEMSSGINYDNLVNFIAEVKTDSIGRGVNWSGN